MLGVKWLLVRVLRRALSSKLGLQKVEVILTVSCERKTVINQELSYHAFFLQSKTCRLSRALHTIKIQLPLILILTDDLNKFLQSSCNVVCIREFLELALYLLTLVEAHRFV